MKSLEDDRRFEEACATFDASFGGKTGRRTGEETYQILAQTSPEGGADPQEHGCSEGIGPAILVELITASPFRASADSGEPVSFPDAWEGFPVFYREVNEVPRAGR